MRIITYNHENTIKQTKHQRNYNRIKGIKYNKVEEMSKGLNKTDDMKYLAKETVNEMLALVKRIERIEFRSSYLRTVLPESG